MRISMNLIIVSFWKPGNRTEKLAEGYYAGRKF